MLMQYMLCAETLRVCMLWRQKFVSCCIQFFFNIH